MTEEQIELRVERETDRLDRQLMDGKLTQDQYDRAVYKLDQWASKQPRKAPQEYGAYVPVIH